MGYGTGDLDGDGLSNLDELIYGTLPHVADTDGDGCPDGADRLPLLPDDTDGDTVCDSADLCNGDDASGDTDGDGVCNDIDACNGCGICANCIHGAISIQDEEPQTHLDLCMGCGVCASKCEQEAIQFRLEPAKGAPLDICALQGQSNEA